MIEHPHTREPDHRGGYTLTLISAPCSPPSHISPVVWVLAIKWRVGQEMPGRLWAALLMYKGGPCVDIGPFFI
jgi:hypothetical protein